MDRYLLPGAIILFILEVTYFFGDLGYYELPFFSQPQTVVHGEPIGYVQKTQQYVRRRNSESIVWETTKGKDQLFAMDSILTLDQSSAKLVLENDIVIEVFENSLVVLEPISTDKSRSLRLKFKKGLFRGSNNKSPYTLSSGQWNFDIAKGTSIRLKSNNKNQIDIEVKKGRVQLNNESSNKSSEIHSGQKFTLGQTQVELIQEVIDELKFIQQPPEKIYSHQFPIPVNFKWQGQPNDFVLSQPSKDDLKFPTTNNSLMLELNPGTYNYNLVNPNGISQTHRLQIISADRLTYFSPLPRNRIKNYKKNDFSWSKSSQANKYVLEFTSTDKDKSLRFPASRTSKRVKLKEKGPFLWKVIGIDEDGFEIPPRHNYPIYLLDDPLTAPKLQKPRIRTPASPKKDGALLEKIWNLIFPKVFAQAKSDAQHFVRFHWFPVEDAEFYTIEISTDPNFIQPVVIQKIKTTNFEWSEFQQQKYYWRVAAGQENGRMGLFSDPDVVDLANIKDLTSKDLSPGVEYHVKPKPKAKPPIAKKIIDLTPTRPKPEKKQLPKPSYVLNSEIAISLGHSFHWESQTGKDFEANLNGTSFMNLQVHGSVPFKNKAAILADVSYNQISWEPDDKNKLPFQNNLEQKSWLSSFTYRKSHSYWNYGLIFHNRNLLKRKQTEQIQLDEIFMYGLGIGGTFDYNEKWFSHHQFNLLSGEGLFEFMLVNELNYSFTQIGDGNLFGQGRLDLNSFSGNSDQGLSVIVILSIGFEI